MAEYYVGLDVHTRESVFVVQRADGTVVGRGRVATDRAGFEGLRTRFGLPAATPVALETGTVAFFVARLLAGLELQPVVVDAHEVRVKAHRPNQKSDSRDAFELCDGIRRDLYRATVHVPPPEISALRETLSRRRHFVRQQTAEVNAAKRLLRSAGCATLSSKSLGTAKAWTGVLHAVAGEGVLPQHLTQHFTLWRCAGEQITTLEQQLHAWAAHQRDAVQRLQTVPGVGPITSLTALAVFSDVTRFPSAKHAASYTGIVPTTYQSGARDQHGHITKRGSRELRAMLCEAAHHARRPDHPLNPYFAALCARRGYKLATIAVAHRLCRILFAMLRDRTDFDPQQLAIEEGPFTRTTTHRYRRTSAKH
jgi:transposase